MSESVPQERPEGFRRVAQFLNEGGHPHVPRWLEATARTSQEAAQALGVSVGQIAKSVIFRRRADDVAVLVVTSGDKRVDEKKVAALVGASYPYVVLSRRFIAPARSFVSPRFASARVASFHHGGMSRGRR